MRHAGAVQSAAAPFHGLGRRSLEVGEPSVTLFDGEAGLLQQPQVAGHARLGDAEDAGELAHVEPLRLQHPQDTQPRIVAKQPEQGRRIHIY